MSFGTGRQALIDQQTAIFKALKEAQRLMNEATPHLRDYPNHQAWQFAWNRAGNQYADLCRLIDVVIEDRGAIRDHGYIGNPHTEV